MLSPLIAVSVAVFVAFMSLTTNASAQQIPGYTLTNADFIMMKICVPINNTGTQYTPLQCTNDVGTLRDVSASDTVTYFRGDYDAITIDSTGNAVLNVSTCRALFGNQWVYDFPLGYTSNLEAAGHPLYIHWVEKPEHEYNDNDGLDCALNPAKLYSNDGFGVLAVIINNSASYMTLMGTDLPTSESNYNANSACSYSGNGTREFAWALGNGYASTNGPGIRNFNEATAIDIDTSNFTNQMPSFNTISLGKQTLIYDSSGNPSNNSSYTESGGPPSAPSSNMFSCPTSATSPGLPNFPGVSIDSAISYSVYFNFTFGPTGSYHSINTTFTNNENPESQQNLNPILPTIMQYGFEHVYNSDAPLPYTGPGTIGAGVSEHIYSTQFYGYATRWELWNEVDLAPTIVQSAVQTYYGEACSHPEWPYQSTGGTVNSDFNYGEPQLVYIPIDIYSGNSLPGATVYAAQAPTTPYLQFTDINGTLYGNTSVIFTSAGTFSFAATSQDPAHYNVYFWPASAGATNFSNPPADYLTNHGGTTLLVGTDGTVYMAAGSNGVSNWYKWVAAGSSGSWVPYGSTSPAPSTTQYNPAWAQVLTVGQGANAVSNIWYMTACDDFTNVWNAVDAKNRTANDSPQKFEVQLPHYPGTTDIPNNDFAHLLGSPYLSYFGVAPF